MLNLKPQNQKCLSPHVANLNPTAFRCRKKGRITFSGRIALRKDSQIYIQRMIQWTDIEANRLENRRLNFNFKEKPYPKDHSTSTKVSGLKCHMSFEVWPEFWYNVVHLSIPPALLCIPSLLFHCLCLRNNYSMDVHKMVKPFVT